MKRRAKLKAAGGGSLPSPATRLVGLTSVASAVARPRMHAAANGAPLAATNAEVGGRDLQAA